MYSREDIFAYKVPSLLKGSALVDDSPLSHLSPKRVPASMSTSSPSIVDNPKNLLLQVESAFSWRGKRARPFKSIARNESSLRRPIEVRANGTKRQLRHADGLLRPRI
jgi:hypothetical protein